MGILDSVLGRRSSETGRGLSREVERLKAENEVLERRNREYFDVIERIEKQRDEWKEMYFTQSAQHQVAQAMLQRRAQLVGEQLVVAVKHLNAFLTQAGHELVQTPQNLEELKDDVAARYGERMKALSDAASVDVDGKAERDRIASIGPA